MTRCEFLQSMDELLEQQPQTLRGPEPLEGVGWDSLSVITFIVMAEEKLGCKVEPRQLAKCKTIDDVVGLVSPHLDNFGKCN
jgi:acyl carrier protein